MRARAELVTEVVSLDPSEKRLIDFTMWLCTIIKALSTSQVLILCINALLVGRQDELFYLHCYVHEYLVDRIA